MSGKMTDSRFRFYEIVRVRRGLSEKTEVEGLEGAILGMAREPDGRWAYGVFLYERESVTHLFEDELEPTGRMDERETFYDGDSVTVVVDPETGEGRVSS